MADLALGDAVPRERLSGAQTPGGTGAIRQLCELVKRSNPSATVWHSDPTWPNHPAILAYLGIPARTYRYFDAETKGVDFAGMMADLAGMKPGDVLLLHGCCHNPTGANLTLDEWREVTDFVRKAGVIPFVDLAYQGFGDGLAEDVEGLRHMAGAVPEMMLAASCSKNFGLYRDRVGAAFVLAADKATAGLARQNLGSLNRLNFSFPPDHGAKVVSIILNDPELKADWMAELEAMRTGHARAPHRPRRGAAPRDQLRPLRLRRRASRHVLAPRPRARAGQGGARGLRHLHGRRQPHQHRGPARGRARPVRPRRRRERRGLIGVGPGRAGGSRSRGLVIGPGLIRRRPRPKTAGGSGRGVRGRETSCACAPSSSP